MTTTAAEGAKEDVRAQKQALRKDIRGQLKQLSQEEIAEQSEKVWNKLKELSDYKTAKSVGLFLSMPKNEISTRRMLQLCVQANKDIYVPQVGKNFESADMELIKVVQDQQQDTSGAGKGDDGEEQQQEAPLFYESWPKNKWQIPEPPSTMPLQVAQPGDIDLLVVPGLAFDHEGNRLGQGKGYYDRFIARMFAKSDKKPPKLVAVCLDCQLLEPSRQIPVQDYDRTMQMILSPSHTITVPAGGEGEGKKNGNGEKRNKSTDEAANESGASDPKKAKTT